MEKMRMPFLWPRPTYVIVDSFDRLVRRYPQEALAWAEDLTNQHTRNNLARVFFVVSSPNGAMTLTNLNEQRVRFKKLVINPVLCEDLWKLSAIDRELFALCEHN